MFHHSSFSQASFLPSSWVFDSAEVAAPAPAAFYGSVSMPITERSQRTRKADNRVQRNNQIIIAAMLAHLAQEDSS